MKKLNLIYTAFLILALASCSDNIESPTTSPTYEENSFFYLDQEQVSQEDYNPNDDARPAFLVLSENESGKAYTYHQFSTDDKFIQYGKENGYDIAKFLEFDSKLQDFVLESDAIAYQEQIGEVNPAHQIAMDELHAKYFTQPSERSPIPTILYDFCAGGPWTLLPGTLPWMGGWRNRVDSYFFPSLITGMLICDRSWNRGPRWIVTGNFQDGRTCLPGWMSDIMESGYHLSI